MKLFLRSCLAAAAVGCALPLVSVGCLEKSDRAEASSESTEAPLVTGQQIVSLDTGACLAVERWSFGGGVDVVMQPCRLDDAQLWRWKDPEDPDEDGRQILHPQTGKCLSTNYDAFGSPENFAVGLEALRAAKSAVLNIAEGAGRFSRADRREGHRSEVRPATESGEVAGRAGDGRRGVGRDT